MLIFSAPTKSIAINVSAKIAWNGISSPKGVGIGANIQLSRSFQFIPEFNIIDSRHGDSNGTLGVRWLANSNTNIDFYISSAAGLQDIGQFIGSDDVLLGTKFNFTY